MMLLDFEVEGDRPLVPIARPCVIETRGAAPEPPGRALGAMKARWYAAIWKVGEVLALKELLEFDDNNGASTLYRTAGALDHEGAASILVQGGPLRFRVRLPRGNTGS